MFGLNFEATVHISDRNCRYLKNKKIRINRIYKEAPSGLEPLNDGFAIHSLSRLGTAPCALKNIAELFFFVHSSYEIPKFCTPIEVRDKVLIYPPF